MRPQVKSGQIPEKSVKTSGRIIHRRIHLTASSGFTLVELVIIIIALGILAGFGIAKYSDVVNESRIKATQSEMAALKRAIIGNPQLVSGGKYVDIGYEGNLGTPPSKLEDLARKPGAVAKYNPISGFGWNGPYIDSSNQDYLTDAWGAEYLYDPSGRTIKSIGSGQDLSLIHI